MTQVLLLCNWLETLHTDMTESKYISVFVGTLDGAKSGNSARVKKANSSSGARIAGGHYRSRISDSRESRC